MHLPMMILKIGLKFLHNDKYLDKEKKFMRKVFAQLKVWWKHSGPPSKIQTIKSDALNVSSLKGSMMTDEGRNNSRHNRKPVTELPLKSHDACKSITPPKVQANKEGNRPISIQPQSQKGETLGPPIDWKGENFYQDKTNNLATNSFAKTPAPKQPQTCHQSFYQQGKQCGFHAPISPYDKNYEQGCNSNVQWKVDEYSEESDPNNSVDGNPSNTFMSQIKEHELKSGGKAMKCIPLPSSVTWIGQGTTLENYISSVEGHVDQQQYMSYILLPLIAK